MENPIDRAPVTQTTSSLPPEQSVHERNYWKAATGFLVVVVILCVLALASLTMKKTMSENITVGILPSVQPLASIVPSTTTPTQTETTPNVQTYTDTTYGFQFQYPSKYQTSFDTSGWPHSVVLLRFAHLVDGQGYSLIVEHWDSLADFQKANSSKSYFKDYTVFNNPKGGIITILNLDKVNNPNDSDPNKVISSFKFTGQVTTSDSLKYTYDTFSFTYPTTWKVSENTTDPAFFRKNNLLGFDHMTLLQNGEYYLLIGIDPIRPGTVVGGIFINNADYQNFLKTHDLVTIQGEKFFLWKNYYSLSDWNVPNRDSGIYGLASLSKYVANAVNNKGKKFDGSYEYFEENGKSYIFMKLSKTNMGENITPPAIQKDIKNILESIQW